jgi:GTP-binding protein HflX
VRDVLAELQVDSKDTLLVLNKIDAVADPATRRGVLARYPHAICISARSGEGLPLLARTVSETLGRGFRDIDVETDPGNGRLLAWLGAHGEVLSRHFAADRMTIHCRIPAALMGRIDPTEAIVTPHVRVLGRVPHDGATAGPSGP